MRKCKYCAEDIQDAAVLCRHCGRDLSATPTPPRFTDPERLALLSVSIMALAVPFFAFLMSGASSTNDIPPRTGWPILYFTCFVVIALTAAMGIRLVRSRSAPDPALHSGLLSIVIPLFALLITGVFFFMTFRIDAASELTARNVADQAARAVAEATAQQTAEEFMDVIREDVAGRIDDGLSRLRSELDNLAADARRTAVREATDEAVDVAADEARRVAFEEATRVARVEGRQAAGVEAERVAGTEARQIARQVAIEAAQETAEGTARDVAERVLEEAVDRAADAAAQADAATFDRLRWLAGMDFPDFDEARTISPGLPQTLDLDAGALSLFRLEVTQTGTYRIDAVPIESGADLFLFLWQGQAQLMSADDDSGSGFNPRLEASLDADTTYYVGVDDLNGEPARYRISVDIVAP